MSSPGDLALARQDPALPALALVLDEVAVREWLRARWPGQEIGSVRRNYLRYKKGTSCLAGFMVSIGGTDTPVSLLARRPDADDKLGKIGLRRERGDHAEGAFALDPALALACYRFPADPTLRHLRYLVGERERGKLLGRLGLPRDALIEILHYRPARRCVARATSGGRTLAVLKMHRPEAFARARANAAAFSPVAGITLPRFIGACERRGVVASAWLDGQAVTRADADPRAIGQAIARLHGCAAQGLARLANASLRQAAEAIAADIAAICPPLAARAHALAAGLVDDLGEAAFPVPLHGDFHMRQVVAQADGHGLGLIDLDEAVLGPAEYDLATFLAHEDLRSPSFAVAEEFASGLLEGYRAARPVQQRVLAAHRALALFRLALRPFREQWTGWDKAIAALLDRVETIRPARPTGAAVGVQSDPAMPQIEEALDCERAGELLRAAGAPYAVERARLARHKPGRRCVIAYDLRTEDGRVVQAFGKIRAKGADSRTFALHQALREGGMVENGARGAYVSRPLALLPDLAMWVQEAARGKPFSPGTCAPQVAAGAIGALHASAIRPLRRHSLDDEIAILEARLAALATRRPELTGRITALHDEALACRARTLPFAQRPVHRDFYQDHLLETEHGPCLLDLDLVALGDPAVDIGNFLAHLTELALRAHGDPGRFAEWQARFLAAACRPGASATLRNARIYEFLSLARLAEIAERMPERRGSVETLLDLAEKHAKKIAKSRRRNA